MNRAIEADSGGRRMCPEMAGSSAWTGVLGRDDGKVKLSGTAAAEPGTAATGCSTHCLPF